MKVTELEISGVFLMEPKVFQDDRGFFFESYQTERFAKHGVSDTFVQDNHSASSKGTLRGMHTQISPKAQAKLVRVVRGSVFDVVADARKDSKTFGKVTSMTLSAENKRMLYVPPGLLHGFLALEDQTEFLYKVTTPYAPDLERGVIWNDTTLNIQWPKLDCDFSLSNRDAALPTFKDQFALQH